MYPKLETTDDPFYKSAGKSIDVLIKLKGFKHPRIGNYWYLNQIWTCETVHGEFKDSDIEEWYEIPKLGSGVKVC